MKLYYEVYGTGESLLLAHGNSGSIEKGIIPFFARYYKVIAGDTRAHGRSADDLIPVPHTVLIWQHIPKAWLWIVPHSGHGTLVEHRDEFEKNVLAFFQANEEVDKTR